MNCHFQVGQKVVCVERFEAKQYPMVYPVLGCIYEIRHVFFDPIFDAVYVRLVEVVNSEVAFLRGREEPAFHVDGFRPLVTRKTDISVFTALLNTSKQSVPA